MSDSTINNLEDMSLDKVPAFIETPKVEVESTVSTQNGEDGNFAVMTRNNNNNSDLNEILENLKMRNNALLKIKEIQLSEMIFANSLLQQIKKHNSKYKKDLEEIKLLIKKNSEKLTELKLEKDDSRKSIISLHKAFKRAAKYYKVHLDFYLQVEQKDGACYITVCFFTQKFDDSYSIVISKNVNETEWTLYTIKPQLDEIQFTALQKRFNKSKNLFSLLCTTRKILLLYKNTKK